MAAIIYRGSTCRIRFRPLNGLSVSSLGEPTIGIKQGNIFVSPENVTVDAVNNCIYADLAESDTIQLLGDVETVAQAVFVNGENVVRFPQHSVIVKDTNMWTLIN